MQLAIESAVVAARKCPMSALIDGKDPSKECLEEVHRNVQTQIDRFKGSIQNEKNVPSNLVTTLLALEKKGAIDSSVAKIDVKKLWDISHSRDIVYVPYELIQYGLTFLTKLSNRFAKYNNMDKKDCARHPMERLLRKLETLHEQFKIRRPEIYNRIESAFSITKKELETTKCFDNILSTIVKHAIYYLNNSKGNETKVMEAFENKQISLEKNLLLIHFLQMALASKDNKSKAILDKMSELHKEAKKCDSRELAQQIKCTNNVIAMLKAWLANERGEHFYAQSRNIVYNDCIDSLSTDLDLLRPQTWNDQVIQFGKDDLPEGAYSLLQQSKHN